MQSNKNREKYKNRKGNNEIDRTGFDCITCAMQAGAGCLEKVLTVKAGVKNIGNEFQERSLLVWNWDSDEICFE